ncbi:MAG: aminopeptidase [Candidatus Pacebacteria bacterium]|nr:aminopeptidase [Candidatus Paceibacterota bacterium]
MADEKTKNATRNPLRWKRQNAWIGLASDDEQAMESYCRDYLDFLSTVKTEREAHDSAVDVAEQAGFRNLDDIYKGTGTLVPGDKVYRSWRGKTLLLAHVGRRPMKEGVRIVGGHTDAPRLDSKPNPIYEDSELVLLDTHYYGGIKKYQWVTLPLAIHGVVIKQDGTKVSVVIGEAEDEPVFTVTDLLPHLGKEQQKKSMTEGVPGENLNVLIGSRPLKDTEEKETVKENILRLLHETYDICEEDFASAELEIVPAGRARELGLDRSMMLGYAHDDRVCAYAALRALLDLAEIPKFTSITLLCDKEEIGSVGATGMESAFFENTIADLVFRIEKPYSDLLYRRCLENSEMISADVSAVHDPNYPDVSAPNDNMAKMNCGIVLSKYTGSRGKSHASEASAEFMARIRSIFNAAGVAWQTGELGKVDVGGGGTIAMFLAKHGMDVLDAGVGLLSMHAPWEVAGKLDAYMTYKGYKAFLADTTREG